jgi:hypothetical protein
VMIRIGTGVRRKRRIQRRRVVAVGHSLANLERFFRFFLGLPSRWRRYTGVDKEW